MLFYIFLFVAVVGILLCSKKKRTTKIAFFILWIVYAFRDNVGVDDGNYIQVFEYIQRGWGYDVEWSYRTLCKLALAMGLNYKILFIIYGTLSMVLLYKAIDLLYESHVNKAIYAFGSEVNGLVNSITQFLGVISFLELGVGAVVQSALYKPLAEKRQDDVSKIISSANKFFTRLGQILLAYVIVLVVVYPRFAGKNFGFAYTATLIVAISISSFAQYFFGIVNRLLLTADQRGYIQYNAQTLAVICNTVACFVLIQLGCSIQIVKLTRVYTLGIHDANYIQPLFAALIVAANAGHCLRLPYNIIILAAGHYKQTQRNYIVAAVINIVVSVVTVKAWGLIGVAIGTLAAMGYQTIWMAIYDSRNLIKWPFKKFIKQIFVDALTVIIGFFATKMLSLHTVTYISWVFLAIKTSAVWVAIVLVLNFIFYHNKISGLFGKIESKIRKG